MRAYQRIQPLTIGELWAVAITLRIVLVENLRRAASRIVSGRVARQDADQVADRLLGLNGYATEPDALLSRYKADDSLPAAFAVQLVLRVRDQDPMTTPARQWLEERVCSQGTPSVQIVHLKNISVRAPPM